MIIVKIMDIFSCNQICDVHNIAEIEENEVYHLVAEGVIISWQQLILFILILYTWFSCIKKIRQSCECWAVGP